MCGIIGLSIKNKKINSGSILKELLLQSQIRGKHATGFSSYKDGKLTTVSEQVPAADFIKKNSIKESVVIAHCRYSTSDVLHNQPIQSKNCSIVHNGVITQRDSKDWDVFGYKNLKTKNDSELLLKCLEGTENPFEKFPNASIAFGFLYNDGDILLGRNAARPLYIFKGDGFVGFASTFDIIKRAFKNLKIDVSIIETVPFKFYSIDKKLNISIVDLKNYDIKDKQIKTSNQIKNKYRLI